MKANIMFKKMDVPGDRTPKAKPQDNEPKTASASNENDNKAADKAISKAATRPIGPQLPEKP